MDDKGEVKCIKFSIGNKILAVQRTSKSVVSSGTLRHGLIRRRGAAGLVLFRLIVVSFLKSCTLIL